MCVRVHSCVTCFCMRGSTKSTAADSEAKTNLRLQVVSLRLRWALSSPDPNLVSLIVDGRGCLVKQEQLGVVQECPSEADDLPFAKRPKPNRSHS
jgi:hypothetical protein